MKETILIVEDEKDIVKMLESRLKAAGYDTIAANDGQQGLEKARSEQPDLILLPYRYSSVYTGSGKCNLFYRPVQNQTVYQ